jgi:dipeptidyl aminopeptidase/acylaminoacyl peptidase
VLNAVGALQRYPQADPARIGMWGHSMGGSITLQVMVATDDVRAGVIWAGMVGTYPEILTWFERRFGDRATPTPDPDGNGEGVWSLVEAYGRPEENPEFWDSISATAYLEDLSGPIQLHHGTADSSVPFEWSEALLTRLEAAGIEAEFYAYENDNHNLSNYFGTAMTRSVEFFDAHLK